jgi:hypothetical protein
MDLSYGPALPLGMEALREVLEFRSARRLEEAEFLVRVNKSLPPGIRFSGLERIETGSPSLHNAMDRLVYSLARKSEAVGPAWNAKALKLALGRFKNEAAGAATVEFRVSGRRLFFELPPTPARGFRVQDVVQAVLGLENPVFLIRRDDIVFKPPGPEIDRNPCNRGVA